MPHQIGAQATPNQFAQRLIITCLRLSGVPAYLRKGEKKKKSEIGAFWPGYS